VTIVRGLAMNAIGAVYVQWQVIRVSDDDAPLCGVRRVVTWASGGMRMGGRGSCKVEVGPGARFGRDGIAAS
jgi:hypothetical protein